MFISLEVKPFNYRYSWVNVYIGAPMQPMPRLEAIQTELTAFSNYVFTDFLSMFSASVSTISAGCFGAPIVLAQY
jgi:hypothetical protein